MQRPATEAATEANKAAQAAKNATESATTATEGAVAAAAMANTATGAATTATTAANRAAVEATAAAGNATTAATKADDAATAANAAAASATGAATAANDAAGAANAAAEDATHAAESVGTAVEDAASAAKAANAATEAATTATTAANNAAAEATAATGNATTAATEATNAANAANIAAEGIDGKIAGKADLDSATGYIKSSQIAPLEGRQTGVNTSDGNFRSTASALLFSGARTIAANFKTGHDVSGTQTIVATSGNIYGMILEFVNGNLVFRCRGAAARVVTGIEPDTYYSVAGTYDGNEIVVYLNDGRVTSASNFSDDLNLQYLAIGSSFKGIVIGCRLFNYALTASEVVDLWNGGEPERYMLPLSGEMRTGLVAEYIAAGLLADKWRDTSGAGLDLPYVPTATGGTAELSYQSVPNQGEIVIDSGIFFTDIAEGTANKRIDVPRGYVALAVAVYNYNASALTNVIVQNWTDERAFIYGATVYNARAVYSVSAAGNKSVYNGTGITIDPTVQYLKVMATGNTTSGGMRVRVICKYLGV